MKFTPGRKKTGGRVAGVPNKFSLSKLKDVLETAQIDPAAEYVALIPNMNATLQKSAYEFLITQLSKDNGDDTLQGQPSGNRPPTLAELIKALPTTHEPKHTRGG